MHMHARAHARTHTYAHMCTHTHMRVRMHTHTCVCVRAHTHKCKMVPEVPSFHDDRNRDVSQKGGSLATQLPDMDANRRKFY